MISRSGHRFPYLRFILCFASSILAASVYSYCRAPGASDPEHLLARMRQSVSLTATQAETIRPLVAELCRSLEDIRKRYQAGQTPATDTAGKDIETSIQSFRDAVSVHLSPEQGPLMKQTLEALKQEFTREASNNPSPPDTAGDSRRSRIGLSVSAPGFGDSLGSTASQLTGLESDKTASPAGTDAKSSKGEWAIAPYPLVSPALGNGLVLITAYIRPLSSSDKASPPSIFGAGGMITSSKSWAAGYGQKLFIKKDRFRILGGFGLAQLNYDFSISDEDTGSTHDIPIHQKGYGFLAGGQVRAYKRWYIGMQYHFLKADTGVDLNELIPELPVDLEPFDLDIHVAGLKAQIERDSRDSQFYPRRGSTFSVNADFNDESFGSDYNFQHYTISHQSYFQLAKRHVLAYTASICDIEGKAPFFGQCMLGSSSDIRGYATGKHQDHRMIVGQVEYRLELPWRFGAAGFIGAGEVADKWSEFSAKDILPGGGLGLRFTLAKSNHVNLRFDYAWGKGSQAWYVGLGEAF